MMDKSSELSQALKKTINYAKNLKLNVGIHPLQQSSETILSHDYPHSAAAGFHKSKKKDSTILSRQGSPRHPRQKRKSNEKDVFNMSCKYPVLKKQFQSQNQRDTSSFNRTTDKVEIKHLTNLLSSSIGGNKQFQAVKKSGHSYTYTHLNDDSDKFSEADGSFYVKPQQKIAKFRHSKSPSKERHIEHNNTSYADQTYKAGHAKNVLVRSSSELKMSQFEVAGLLKQINRLQGMIQAYQGILMKMKHKYLELQDKLKDKMLNDHYIDVLKKQVEEVQENNHRLNITIKNQRETIDKFQNIFVSKIRAIREYYEMKVQESIQLAKENQFLKRIMMIAISNPQIKSQPKQEKLDKKDEISNSYLRSMTKSVDQFNEKWK